MTRFLRWLRECARRLRPLLARLLERPDPSLDVLAVGSFRIFTTDGEVPEWRREVEQDIRRAADDGGWEWGE